MIFIDIVNRIKQLPEREEQNMLRRRNHRPVTDELSLSDAATHVLQIALTYRSSVTLTPTDSIIANMLEVFIQQLDNLDTSVRALSELAPKRDDWEVVLQTPPVEPKAPASLNYANNLKAGPPQAHIKTFELHIHGRYSAKKVCYVSFFAHHLEQTLWDKLQQLSQQQSIITPYTSEQLDPLLSHWLFEIDQDGEPDPLRELYDREEVALADYKTRFITLQIWFERHQDALPLLISDQRLGYIYIGNYEANIKKHGADNYLTLPPNDIDTNA